jgi:hypothetical protein
MPSHKEHIHPHLVNILGELPERVTEHLLAAVAKIHI